MDERPISAPRVPYARAPIPDGDRYPVPGASASGRGTRRARIAVVVIALVALLGALAVTIGGLR